MGIPTYNQGYPQDGSSLGQSKLTIRNNLDGTFQTLAVDHINNNGQPGSKPAGYHKVIHMVPQSANPGAIAGYGQLFTKTVNSIINDTQLFWETSTGLIQQLTVNITPRARTNGYTFLPGGIIIQWGVVNSPGQSGTVTFTTVSNINFPNNCWNVQLTQRRDASNSTQGMYLNGSPGTSSFKYNGSSSDDDALFWVAIGN
jgi:hypothetical protein